MSAMWTHGSPCKALCCFSARVLSAHLHYNSGMFTHAMHSAGEEASNSALQATTARLASANSLLCDVAAVQRHAEQLCPGQHPIRNVSSDPLVDEPESSHAVHAERAYTDMCRQAVEGTLPAAFHQDASDMPGDFYNNPTISLEEWFSNTPPALVSACPAGPADLLTGNLTSDRADANPVADVEFSDTAAEAPAAGTLSEESPLSAVARGSGPSRAEAQESPLPAMMSELQQAMAASISSHGTPAHALHAVLHSASCESTVSLKALRQSI